MTDGNPEPRLSRPFLARPNAIPGESKAGLLLRFAGDNALGGIKYLARAAELETSDLLQLSAEATTGLLWPAHPQRLRLKALLSRMAPPDSTKSSCFGRVCARCLASDPIVYVRESWDSPFEFTCREHNVLLLDVCPTCGRRLDYFNRPSVDECACGQLLSEVASTPTPRWTAILGWVFATNPESGIDNRAREIAAARATLKLASIDHQPDADGPSTVHAGDALLTSEALLAVEPWFTDWPRGFVATMKSSRKANSPDRWNSMREHLSADIFPAIADAMDAINQIPRPTPIASPSEIVLGLSSDTAWYPKVFARVPLPRTARPPRTTWQGGAGRYRLRLETFAATLPAECMQAAPVSIPTSGIFPLLLAWMVTEARYRESPQIRLGAALRSFMAAAGVEMVSGGRFGASTRVLQTLRDTLSCRAYVSEIAEGKLVSETEISSEIAHLASDASPRLVSGNIIVSDWFYKQSMENALRVSLAALKGLKSSGWATSVYLWLLAAGNEGALELRLRWDDLIDVFDARDMPSSKFRLKLSDGLKRVSETCPSLSWAQSRHGLAIEMSRRFVSRGS